MLHKLIPFLLMLSGCQVHTGLAVHDTSFDSFMKERENPLGVIRASEDIGNTQLFYEHVSGLTDSTDGYGLNMLGILVRIK